MSIWNCGKQIKPRYVQSISTEDESMQTGEKTATKKFVYPMNVVTTDIIKGSQCEFDHKQGEIEDNHPGRKEIIKRPTEGAKARETHQHWRGGLPSPDETYGLNSGHD